MTSETRDAKTIRVYYRTGHRFVLGPLGVFAPGEDHVLPDGTRVSVGSLDADGAAVAWAEAHLVEKAEREGITYEQALETKRQVQTCNGRASLNVRQIAQLEMIWYVNNKRWRAE